MKNTARKLLAAVLALMMILTCSAAFAEDTTERFEELGLTATIPDTVMYVTMASPEDAPLYELLKQVEYTYDSFREFMTTNGIIAYGLFLTDYSTEFQIAAGTIGAEIDLKDATEEVLNDYLAIAANGLENGLENFGVTIEDSGIVHGQRYNGFWFHYRVTANGREQSVIQYSILDGNKAINMRAYSFQTDYPAEAEEILRTIFDTIIIE
ncbi:MAG: hypothetical protein K6E17_08105 [Clostridiales bacterium]|nr:hypothetical protein [Clostridiales bacterium]